MKFTPARYIPMIRFFVSWILFLGGMYLAVTNLYLQSDILGVRWSSLSNDESRLIYIYHRLPYQRQTFIARTDDYATHYRLGDELRYIIISPDRERVFYIEDNRMHIADVPNSQTHTLTINGNDQVNWCNYPIWSPDSEWVAMVLLDNDQMDCNRSAGQGLNKHVILISRDGQTTRNLFSFTENMSVYLILWAEDSQSIYLEIDNRPVVSTLDGSVSTLDSTFADLGLSRPREESPQQGIPAGLDTSDFGDRGNVFNMIVGVLAVMLALVLTFWWKKVESAYRRVFPST